MADPQRRRREAQPALGLVGLAALLLVGVVAVASRAHRAPGGSGSSHAPSAAFVDDLASIAALVFLLGAVALLRVLHLRRREAPTGPQSKRENLIALLVLLGILAIVLVVVRQRAEVPATPSPPPLQALPKAKPPAKPTPETGSATKPYEPSFRWLPVALAGGLGLAAIAALLVLRARRRARVRAPEEPSLEDALALVLDDALDDLRRERDVRRAIVAAYARMERLLAAHGLPRRTWEAPLEYLDRVLGELSASRGSVARLTRLFERAKFGRGDLPPGTKEEAIGALETLRAELGRGTA